MRILIITPAPPRSRAGNRATAVRWGNILQKLGHQVSLSVEYDDQPCDALIGLHAWRSAEAIQQFHKDHPSKPLIVALTGTDLYRFITSHPEPTLHSIKLADRLVVLHSLAYKVLPEDSHEKLRVIHQSAQPLPYMRKPLTRYFDVCVAGHLRDEKDPMRAALAARELPQGSRIRIRHYGKAHDESWASQARQEMKINPRYHWFGEIPHSQVRKAYARSQLMVLSSRMEGGANVISEACVAGLPVIASRIDGSVGLLGEQYCGYYSSANTQELQALLIRAEQDEDFLRMLTRQCREQAELFMIEREIQSWQSLLAEF